MKISRLIPGIVILFFLLIPSSNIQAQNTATVESFFGEDSFMDGYDFSAYSVQRWGESGPDNAGLYPDFYLGDSNFAVTTAEYHNPKPMINYGPIGLSSITEVPAISDSRFANQVFVQGNSYGMFTNEGDYVVLQVLNLTETVNADYEPRSVMSFDWKYVEEGLTGELTISLYPHTKTEFSLGEDLTVGGDVFVGGQPLEGAEVCVEVWEAGNLEIFYEVCVFSASNGHFSFLLEYGKSFPTGFRGFLTASGDVSYNGSYATTIIDIPYGDESLDQALDLVLIGPDHTLEIGGWEDIGIAGTITSGAATVDGALVTMSVDGQSFQTTTGTNSPGQFNWYWSNTLFPAGIHQVEVTISKDGYKTVTGSVPFTLIGEGYDYWVRMDPIPSIMQAGDQVPFPGTLTLGGNPISDWVTIYVTFPNGRTNSYRSLTDAEGRFTHNQPSLNELGDYDLVVHYEANDKLISDVYNFSVEAEAEPTAVPGSVITPPKANTCEIVEVDYPGTVLVGEMVNVRGKIVCIDESENIIPQEGWEILAFGTAQSQAMVKANSVYSNGDGSFNASFTAKIYVREIGISAKDPETGNRPIGWHGALNVVVDIKPEISLAQTDFDQGDILSGELTLNPNYPAENWDAGIEIFYRISGPEGPGEKQYLFESHYYYVNPQYNIHNIIDAIYWSVPHDAGGGKFTITAHISGFYIETQSIEYDFYINDLIHTQLNAFLQPDPEGWVSATLIGQYTDNKGVPIPNANVRVSFQIIVRDKFTNEIKSTLDYELTGNTDDIGNYEIDLEPLDLFAGQGQKNPWEPNWVVTTVYAEKEGFATGAANIDLLVPTVKANLEIISVNPPLDYLSNLAQGGLSYEELTKMDIQVRVRYNNIFTGDSNLTISAKGNWAVNCTEDDSNLITFKPYLSINGDKMPDWEAYSYSHSGVRKNTLPYYVPGIYGFYPYPNHVVSMPVQTGMDQVSSFNVSGELFGLHYNDNSPLDCYHVYGSGSPDVPPPWSGTAVNIKVNLGSSSASVYYNISPPTIIASGSAWVSPKAGEFNGNLFLRQASGYVIRNQQVNLSIVSVDRSVFEISPETEKTTSAIGIAPSAKTDNKGKITLAIEAKENPCDLVGKESYYVKLSSSALNGNQYIPIELRCVRDLAFEIGEDFIIVQAADLSHEEAIQLVSGKETGVRVYLKVDGEIFQPENQAVQFKVLFEMFRDGDKTPLFPQIKTISLTEKGGSVFWFGQAPIGNNALTGKFVEWKNPGNGTDGEVIIPLDFAFIPYQIGGSSTKYTIRITVDPDKVYGDSEVTERSLITVKKMKRLQILFVPIQRPHTYFEIDKSFLLKQINFMNETFPLADGDIGWSIAPNFIWDDDFKINAGLQWTNFLGRLALAVGDKYGSSSDSNVVYRVVGIVQDETWLRDSYLNFSTDATGVYYSNGIAFVRQVSFTQGNTLAHEIGHSLGLYTSSLAKKIVAASLTFTGEQYELSPKLGLPVHGYIMRDSRIYELPSNVNDSSNVGWIVAFGGNLLGAQNAVARQGDAYESAFNIFDLMGKGSDSWVIPHTYNALFEQLKDPPGEQILTIQGGVLEDNTIEFLPIWQSEGHSDVTSEEGTYTLEMRSSLGDVLYQTKFSVEAGWPGTTAIFSIKVPYTPGTTKIVILDETQIAGEINRSGFGPEIQIVTQPELVDENTISISWSGIDLDEDPLVYSLDYQCDNPTFWFSLSANIRETSYSFDSSGLPGGESCKIRLKASDGFNVAESISDPFGVLSKTPEITIFTEAGSYDPKSEINLSGMAYDPEDGILPNENLRWVSDIDGELGFGSALSIFLTPGKHILELFAMDSTGNISIATIQVEVQNSNLLTELWSQMQSNWIISVAALGIVVMIVILFFITKALRKRRKLTKVVVQAEPDPQPNTVQDDEGNWWYQDPNTEEWYFWDGQAWIIKQVVSEAPIKPPPPPIQSQTSKSKGTGCLPTIIIFIVISALVMGGVTLAALNFFPSFTIQPASIVSIEELLKNGGGGLLILILGILFLRGGFKSIATKRAIFEDDMGRQREKRGCSAILDGLGRVFLGLVFLIAGVGMIALVIYQQVLPLLEF